MELDRQISWGTVDEDRVLVLFTLGSRECSCWSVLLFDFDSLWAFVFEDAVSLGFYLFFIFTFSLVTTGGWWQYAMREHSVYDNTV